MFYKCQDQDIWLNLNYMESISIEKSLDGKFLVCANPLESNQGNYILEAFEDYEEAKKCINYIMDHEEDIE